MPARDRDPRAQASLARHDDVRAQRVPRAENLELALRDKVIGQAPVAKSLQAKLDDVLAEQESRARLTDAC